MNRTTLRKSGAVAAALTLFVGLSACGAGNESSDDSGDSTSELTGTLVGAGASSQKAAVDGWKAAFQSANPDVTVNYDPIGSGGGREQFAAGGSDFAGSDAYFSDEQLATAKERCGGDIVEVPAYNSPIALIYNLEGVDDLQLSPETIGAIFAGKIDNWNDDAIAKDNPGVDLPDQALTPVHRSDDSGTTENFTEFLDAAAKDAWGGGVLETWPKDFGGEGAQGTSGVVSAVEGGAGTIGYADNSQAGDLAKAALLVNGETIELSSEAAAKTLEESEPVAGRGETDLAIDVKRTDLGEGVYPIVLVSYQVACLKYEDADKAALVKAWMDYVVSEEGQAEAEKTAGAAPLSASLMEQAKTAIDQIS